jgi:hypothetical protein
LGDGASLIALQTMDLFPHSSPDRRGSGSKTISVRFRGCTWDFQKEP